MYGFIEGIIEYKFLEGVVINVNGIGYNIVMPAAEVLSLPLEGERIRIHTYTKVSQDSITLYGFTKKETLELFKLLITVSGIGPKGGQAILSTLSDSELVTAILNGDSKTISMAPGVGKKSAERVIIDLKDKVKSFDYNIVNDNSVVVKTEDNSEANEAVMALVALGYSSKEAKEAVNTVIKDGITGSDNILRGALKYL